jgi:hypothetical protein
LNWFSVNFTSPENAFGAGLVYDVTLKTVGSEHGSLYSTNAPLVAVETEGLLDLG